MKGYGNRVLRVNLSTKLVFKKNLNRNYIYKYMGCEGYGAALLWYETPYNAHAFSPRNLLCFNTGPLTGTPVLSALRMAVTYISPVTNTIGVSNLSGHFGKELKLAGYDSIIIEGMSDNPVYLYIDDDKVEIRDACHLWGKDTKETANTIIEELGNDFEIASIGQAGERLSRLACISSGNCFSEKGGAGAVMGYKRLKAIAIRGSGSIEVADRGSLMSSNIYNNTEEFSASVNTCHSCRISCSKYIYTRDNSSSGLGYETVPALGTMCGIDSPEAIAQASCYTSIYGIDPISTGAMVSAAMKWYEEGIITDSDTDGIELNFGNSKAVIELIRKIGLREGAGETFADGLYYAALKIGKAAMDSISVKNAGIRSEALKGIASMASQKSNCDQWIYEAAVDAFGYIFPDLGIDKPNNPLDENESKDWVKALREYSLALNLLGICGLDVINTEISPTTLAGLYTSVTGIEADKYELLRKAERTIALKEAINYKRGLRRNSSHLLTAFFTEPALYNPLKNRTIDMYTTLSKFHEACGLDCENAVPSKEKYIELGMDDITEKL